jgi:hypothetical protein
VKGTWCANTAPMAYILKLSPNSPRELLAFVVFFILPHGNCAPDRFPLHGHPIWVFLSIPSVVGARPSFFNTLNFTSGRPHTPQLKMHLVYRTSKWVSKRSLENEWQAMMARGCWSKIDIFGLSQFKRQ